MKIFKRAASGTALGVALLAVPTWNALQHYQSVKAAFRGEVFKNKTPRMMKITTDGVTREGALTRGGAVPVITFGFYDHPSTALLVAANPASACWSARLQVTEGQQNLPLLQKIFNGQEYVRVFDNSAFNSLGYTCAPLANNQP